MNNPYEEEQEGTSCRSLSGPHRSTRRLAVPLRSLARYDLGGGVADQLLWAYSDHVAHPRHGREAQREHARAEPLDRGASSYRSRTLLVSVASAQAVPTALSAPVRLQALKAKR